MAKRSPTGPIATLRQRVDAYWVNGRDAGDGVPIDHVLRPSVAALRGP
jgi:hypothetical protein